ncbi:MAG: hypothetical protein JW874_04900 [Spirochaetales bacterium]|nr:hypothetical protein [Spirochaetales bacterium]
MTTIYLLSEDKKIINAFTNALNGSLYRFEIFAERDFRQCLKKMLKGSIIYIDIQKFENGELQELLQYLPKLDQYNYAVVDTAGKIKDMGSLFLNGVSDYISRTALEKNLDIRRFKKAIEFYPLETEGENDDVLFSGRDWKKIREGKEYTFCFLYVQMELKETWLSKTGKDFREQVKKAFYRHIESEVAEYNGRIWIREEFKQIVLFPYDGESCDSVILPIRLMLNRILDSAEKYGFSDIVEFSMVFHIGSTLYLKSGNTGSIISDDINLIHHISSIFGKKGNLYISQNAAAYIPEGLMPLFVDMGTYKNQQIYRMKQPLIC